jgi:hypothetical protein
VDVAVRGGGGSVVIVGVGDRAVVLVLRVEEVVRFVPRHQL